MSKKQCETGACPSIKTSIGGQALMEGIMMRGPHKTAMAVRNTKGEIVLEMVPMSDKKRLAILKWPIIRGVVGFASSMTLGYKCLMRSAELSGLEELEEEMKQEKAAKKAAKAAKKAAQKNGTVPEEPVVESVTEPVAEETTTTESKPETSATEGTPSKVKGKKKGMSPLMWVITALSAVLVCIVVVGLFFLLPDILFDGLASGFDWVNPGSSWQRALFNGGIRLLLLVIYMSLISLMKDIRRTFMYHGAEHKTIFCYEKGLELTVENVRKQSCYHPRCGTSFLILMLLVGIVVNTVMGYVLPDVITDSKLLFLAIRLALIPLIAGIGSELIKICGRYDNWLTRIIAAPGVALQHLTVFEPDDGMIECAIAAVKEVIPEDGSDRI